MPNPRTTIVQNPCVRICTFDPRHDVCIGCYRSSTERGRWYTMSMEEQLATLAMLDLRKLRLGDLMKDVIIVEKEPTLQLENKGS